ncbi:MAG TPA: 5'-3' exonuclease [Mycobacteriales bacterium]|nr:5'-3' exonuclease [Mycobacteriales bacterium]
MADRSGPSLLALDGPSLWFRTFYGVPDTVRAPDGTLVNAVRGFLDYVARLLTDFRPDDLVVTDDWDWRPQWRVDLIPSYKTHRLAEGGGGAMEEPDELGPQVLLINAFLAALGIASIGVDGFEADDVLGTLVARSSGPAWVVTGDRDLFQLVRDEPSPVRIVYAVEKMKLYGPAEVHAKYGIPGTAYADFALLRGDASDGLPGVKGIGEKTAAALLNRFGSLEGIRAALADGADDGFPAGSRAKLLAAADYIVAAEPVVRVRDDVPLPEHDPTVPRSPAEPALLVELVDATGLDSSVDRVLKALEVCAQR